MKSFQSMGFLRCVFRFFGMLHVKNKAGTLIISKGLVRYSKLLLLGIFLSWIAEISPNILTGASESGVSWTVDYIRMFGNRTVHIICLFEAWWKRGLQKDIFEKLEIIEGLISRYKSTYSSREATFSKIAIISFVISSILYCVVPIHVYTILAVWRHQYYFWYYMIYFGHLAACGVRYMQIVALLYFIKLRFDTINDIFKGVESYSYTTKIAKMQNESLPSKDIEYENLERFHTVQDCFTHMWQLTILVNQCFGLSLLANLVNDFISITANTYYVFLNLKDSLNDTKAVIILSVSVVRVIPHLYNIILICCVCELTFQSAKNILMTAQKICFNSNMDEQNSAVEQFLLQLLHQKIEFSANGFFNVDLTIIYKIAGAITTYVIILIQFYLNEEHEINSATPTD